MGKFRNDGREKLSTGIPEEDTERQVQDGDAIDCDESQGSSMNDCYYPGELVVGKNFKSTIVWTDELDDAVDHLVNGEIATVISEATDSGWVKLLSPRGKQGFIHYTNLKLVM